MRRHSATSIPWRPTRRGNRAGRPSSRPRQRSNQHGVRFVAIDMIEMCRTCVWSLVIALTLVPSLRAQSMDPPPTLMPEGGTPLRRAAAATRIHLLGLIELYRVAVYVGGSMDRASLLSPDVSKAVRVQVLYQEDSRQRIGIDWRAELIPRLESAATAHLRGTFAPIRRGDVVLIEYVPGKGTAVRVNQAVAVSGVNHDLMLAFLDHWVGQRPLSEEIKRTLVGS
jgi:hypothetical protein